VTSCTCITIVGISKFIAGACVDSWDTFLGAFIPCEISSTFTYMCVCLENQVFMGPTASALIWRIHTCCTINVTFFACPSCFAKECSFFAMTGSNCGTHSSFYQSHSRIDTGCTIYWITSSTLSTCVMAR
jgi:hypothetical protein